VTTSAERLPRLLALVPWLLAHPDTPVGDVAREFAVSEKQVRADLDLIFVCGLPGHSPGDLMTVEYSADRVTLSNADTLARPLRLSAEEALALIVALRTMVDVPRLGDAVTRALAKLETAVGDAADAAGRLAIVVDNEPPVLDALSAALAAERRVHLSYYVPGRDEITERDVDPMRVTWAGGRPYLEGYCRNAEAVRLFRLDRVHGLTVLEVAAEVPAEASSRDLDEGLYQPAPGDLAVELELDPPARWVADYYPCDAIEEREGGGLAIRLRTAEPGWVIRLVLGLGPTARITAPAEVAQRLRAEAAAALELYGAAP